MRKKSIFSSTIDTLNSGLSTTNDTLKYIRTAINETIEESKIEHEIEMNKLLNDLEKSRIERLNSKKSMVKKLMKMGYTFEESIKTLKIDVNYINFIENELKDTKMNNSITNPNNEIIKRLEIIKSSISIEDEEIIELQIMKLYKLNIDDDLICILKYLEDLNYKDALKNIEEYLKRNNGIVQHVDREFQALKLELKNLESTLQELIIEKTEYLNSIDEFNKEYNMHLGELIRSILKLKKEILYKQTIKQQKAKEKYQEDIKKFEETKETIDELRETIIQLKETLKDIDEEHENYDEIYQAFKELQEELEKLENDLELQEEELKKTKEFISNDEIEKEYEDVKSSYKEFENEYEHIKDEYDSKIEISEDEKKELKKLYKKAARLCHPDIVPDELKEKAHDLMQKLNEAYGKQDIKEVKKILFSLETGDGFELTSDRFNDKELLKEKIKEYKENISNLQSEIEEIKHDETYQTISELDDWDEYFEKLKSDLEEEKNRLEKKAREVFEEKNEIEDTPEWIQKLWEWADKYGISNAKISRNKEKLLATSTLDLTGIKVSYLPKEIVNLENLKELLLWDCDLNYLPLSIIKLENLTKLNIRGNFNLSIIPEQNYWIHKLEKAGVTVFKDDIKLIDINELKIISENKNKFNDSENNLINLAEKIFNWIENEFYKLNKIYISKDFKANLRVKDESKKLAKELISNGEGSVNLPFLINTKNGPINFNANISFDALHINNKNIKSNSQTKIFWPEEDTLFNDETWIVNEKINKNSYESSEIISKTIDDENNSYSNFIQSIENINFEKIRRYCNNLLNDNKADDMQIDLAQNGKKKKALVYDALEQFIETFNGNNITLIDWECGQGISSMLVLDYIKEKQLDITIDTIILIEENKKTLERAITNIKALNKNIDIQTYNTSINDFKMKSTETVKINICSNIFNDNKTFLSNNEIDNIIENQIGDNYFLFTIENNNDVINNAIEEFYNYFEFFDSEIISSRNSKIGRFKRYEKIFKVSFNKRDIFNEIPF